MKTKQQTTLRMYVRAREDFQSMRIRIDNRLGRKADGSEQNIDERFLEIEDAINFNEISKVSEEQEKKIDRLEKKIKELEKKLNGQE